MTKAPWWDWWFRRVTRPVGPPTPGPGGHTLQSRTESRTKKRICPLLCLGASAERLQAGAVTAGKGLRGFSAAAAALAQAEGKRWAAHEQSVHETLPVPPFPPHPGSQSSNAAGAKDLELQHGQPACRAEHPQISSSPSGPRQRQHRLLAPGMGYPGGCRLAARHRRQLEALGCWGRPLRSRMVPGRGSQHPTSGAGVPLRHCPGAGAAGENGPGCCKAQGCSALGGVGVDLALFLGR